MPGLSCGMWNPVPWPGIEPGAPALGVQSLSHWTTKQVPPHCFLFAANCLTFHCMGGGFRYCSLRNRPPLVKLSGYLFCLVLFLPFSCLLAGFRDFRDLGSVQSLSRVRLFVTPWTEAHQAALSITNSQSLLKLMSIESVMPSDHLIICWPSFPASGSFPVSRFFASGGQSIGFSLSISPSNEYSGLISFRIDWLDLLAVQRTLKSLVQHHSSKASIFQCSTFFIVQLSHPLGTTGKTLVLTRWTFVGKVTSLLFNMLSRMDLDGS